VLIVQAFTSLKYTPGTAQVPNFLPSGRAFRLFDVNASWSDVITTQPGW
jgi:hypothetical protein